MTGREFSPSALYGESKQAIVGKLCVQGLVPEGLRVLDDEIIVVPEICFSPESRTAFRKVDLTEDPFVIIVNFSGEQMNRAGRLRLLTQGIQPEYDPRKWSSLSEYQKSPLEECLNVEIEEVLPRFRTVQFNLPERKYGPESCPVLDGARFSRNPRVRYRQEVHLGISPQESTKEGVLLLVTSRFLGGWPGPCVGDAISVCALDLPVGWRKAVIGGRFVETGGQLTPARPKVESYPLRGFDYSGGGWRTVAEGTRQANRILEANSHTQADIGPTRSRTPKAAAKVEQPARWLSEYQPAIDSEEGHFLDLLKTKPGEAFEQMRSQTEDFPDIIAGRFPAGTKAAKFGSKATPVRLLRKEDRMMIVLEGLNTEELIRQVATEALNLSSLETCLGQAGSSDSFVMEIDGLAGNWQIKTGIARIDIGRMQYADVIPYLRSQIVNQSRVRPDFSEQELRRYVKEGFGTAEALAYVFSRLKASEESRSGIKKMTREDYLRVYGPRPKRKSYYYADW